MDPAITDFKTFIGKVTEQLKEDLKIMRSGKASTALLETLNVEAYSGTTKLPLNSLATLTLSGPTTIVITPFDPATSKDIEKALQQSPLGINPQPQGNQILVNLPPLSEEQREKIVKLISAKVEEKKGMIRNERDNARKKIKQMHEQKTITEDDKFRMEKEVDTLTQKATEDLHAIRDRKEQEMRDI